MNILIEGGDLNPPFTEGTRNIVMTHATSLLEKGHKVVIITRNKSRINGEIFGKYEESDGIKFFRWSGFLEFIHLYKKIIKEEQIDIVHSFAKGIRPNIYFKLLRIIKKKPFMYSLLGWPSDFGDRTRKKILRFLKSVDCCFISSETIFNELKEDANNVFYLPFGIDIDKFRDFKKKGELIIGFRDPSEETVNAFMKLKSEFKNYKFVFNSSTIGRDNKNLALIKENFDLLKEGENMPDVYNRTKILVDLHDSSRHLLCASPPAAVLEAMSCGVNIISTAMPEIKEVIEDNKTGFLIENNSEKEIYEKIRDVLKGKLDVGNNAEIFVRKNYDIRTLIPKYEDFYKKYIPNLVNAS